MKRVNKGIGIGNAASDLEEVFLVASNFEMKPVPDFQKIVSYSVDEEPVFQENNTNGFATWNMPPQDVSIRRYPSNGLLF